MEDGLSTTRPLQGVTEDAALAARPRNADAARSIYARYAALVVANGAAASFGFLIASVVAWRFGPSGMGTIALAGSIVTYATLISTCGTEIHAVRIGAAGRSPLAALASSVIVVRLGLAAAVYAGIIALTFVVPGFQGVRPIVALLGLTVFTTAGNVSWVPQAIHCTNVVAFATTATQGLACVFLLFWLEATPDLAAVPAARIAAEVCVAAGLLVWMRRNVGPLAPPQPARELWRLLQQSAPIGGTQLLRGLALGSDPIVLGLLVSTEELGVYAAAFKVFQLLLALGTAYFIILLPRVAERAHDGSAMAAEIRTSLKRVLPIAALGLILVAAFGGFALQLLFGPAFGKGALSLLILSMALLANLSFRHYRQVLLACSLQRVDLHTSVISAGVNLGAKVLLIPVLGIVGAAVGTLLGETVLLALQYRVAQRTMDMRASAS